MKTINYKKRSALLLVILLLWTAAFAVLTFQNGDATHDTGMRIAQFMKNLFDLKADVVDIHIQLRTAAHFVFTAIETLLMVFVIRNWVLLRNRDGIRSAAKAVWIPVGVSFVFGLLISVLAEVVKTNIPGRHNSPSDMLLNSAGAVGGVILGLVTILIKRNK